MSESKKSVGSIHSFLSHTSPPAVLSASKMERHDERSPSVSFQLNNESSPAASYSLSQNPNLAAQSSANSVGYQASIRAHGGQQPSSSPSLSRSVVQRLSDNYERREKSITSESLCNFSESTPYRLGHSGITPFSSDEHGGIIGSPLSAFSAVGASSASRENEILDGTGCTKRAVSEGEGGGAFSMMLGSPRYIGNASRESSVMLDGTGCTKPSASEGRGGEDISMRETSLLVSPRYIRNENEESTTPSTVRRQGSPGRNNESDFNKRTNYDGTATTLQRDPTPYNERSNGNSNPLVLALTSPTGSLSSSTSHNHLLRSGGSMRSDSSSRSGRDPPAKSPFPSSISSNPYFKSNGSIHHSHSHTQNNHGHNEETELSMIEENTSLLDESIVINQSHVSTVTAFTSPRTPIMRKTNNANDGTTSVASGRFGNTPMSTATMMHRPSIAMRESLNQIATQTAHELEETWDLVGVAPEDRAAQLADLVENIAKLCEDKVAEERGLAEQFRKEIAELRKEWEDSCQALQIGMKDPVQSLKRDPSANAVDQEGISLQSEYEAISSRLENVRSAKAAATADIMASQMRIYKAFAALDGCTVEEAASAPELERWKDVSTNLTEAQRDLFRTKAEEYEESVESRIRAVVSLLRDCQSVIRELGIVPPGCLSENEREMYRRDSDHGPGGKDEVGRSEDDAKIMKSLKLLENYHSDGQRRHSRRRSASDYTIVSLFESPSCTGIGKDTLERLSSRLEELNGEKRRRRATLSEMGAAISVLWTMLRVPPEEQRAFTESVRGLGMETIRKGERELMRLYEMKADMIGKLIHEQRARIQDLWEKTNTSEAEKATFAPYFNVNDDDKLTDELLRQHEQYVASLMEKLEKMQPILDLIAKREAIVTDRFELDNLQKDPDRLKQRGASLTKQLMKEEKMNRRVKKELPKITQILEKTLIEWYEANRPSDEDGNVDPDLGHFMYHGAPYLRTMQTQEEDWQMRKERGEQERQRKREEERSASSGSAFGSTYAKLPGKKWHPTAVCNGSRHKATEDDGDRPRSASNVRGRALADVSSSRQNVSRAVSRPRNDRGPSKVASNNPSFRATSAPRLRL